MSRTFAMPNSNTFSIAPIGAMVTRYLAGAQGRTIDMFARDNLFCTYTNDLNPATAAQYHLDAEEFCERLFEVGEREIHVALFDPPYSPRQISECYKSIGRDVTGKDTQNAALYKRVRDALDKLIVKGGLVLSFGWSSNGMGKTRGYEIEEIMLVAHGGAHNDTICLAERKL